MFAALLVPLLAHHAVAPAREDRAIRLASFQIVDDKTKPQHAQPALSAPPGPAASPAPVTGSTVDGAADPDAPKPSQHHFRMAVGFGQHVPLAFAVRQIVPRGVKTTFGPGTDQNAPVDWQGGRTWNRVLATTVASCGYRIDVGHNAVAILKLGARSSHDGL